MGVKCAVKNCGSVRGKVSLSFFTVTKNNIDAWSKSLGYNLSEKNLIRQNNFSESNLSWEKYFDQDKEGKVLLNFLTLPTTANKVFPYQVRTTQVAAMQETDCDGTLAFSHHMYAPSAPLPPTLIPVPDRPELGPQTLQADWTTNVPVELFCISRTVDSQSETIIPLKPPASDSASVARMKTCSVSSDGDNYSERNRYNHVHRQEH